MTPSRTSRTVRTARAASNVVALYGNTFPVKDKLYALGGKPLRDADGKWYWQIPAEREAEARALLPAYSGGSRSSTGTGASDARWAAFKPTAEQAVIADFVRNQTGNLFMKAGAGCGKTTVALWLLSQLAGTKVMVAFNSHIADEIKEKASVDTHVLTMNALGFRALIKALGRKLDVQKDNNLALIKAEVGESKMRDNYAYYKSAADLMSKAKGALVTSEEEFGLLAVHFDIRFEREGVDSDVAQAEGEAFACSMLGKLRAMPLAEIKTIDFDDQQWLPVIHNLPMPQFDLMVIDESQDTNALQLDMLSRCVRSAGRVIAVGDPRQAINGFRGADRHAISKIVERFSMTTLPLMTTFRCGKAIVREAQKIVPEFQAGENNHEGEVTYGRPNDFFSQVRPGDLVLSRTNAPLASACIRLLQMGRPAVIAGRNGDLVASLVKLIEKTKTKTVAELEAAIETWFLKEQARAMRKLPIREEVIDAARDKADTILAFCEGVDTVAQVIDRIERLFREEAGGAIKLSSVHKIKGGEAKNVFLFVDTFLLRRKNRATGEWLPPSEEEENLLYVGITRAMDRLMFVDGMKKLKRD